jgi:hypothetical protein
MELVTHRGALYTVSTVVRKVPVSVKVRVKLTCKQKHGSSEPKLRRGSMGQPEVIMSVVR